MVTAATSQWVYQPCDFAVLEHLCFAHRDQAADAIDPHLYDFTAQHPGDSLRPRPHPRVPLEVFDEVETRRDVLNIRFTMPITGLQRLADTFKHARAIEVY
jgi:hypothetical protein